MPENTPMSVRALAARAEAAIAKSGGVALATPHGVTPRRSIRGRLLAEPGAAGSPRGMRLPDQHPSVEISAVGWVDEDETETSGQPDESNTDVDGGAAAMDADGAGSPEMDVLDEPEEPEYDLGTRKSSALIDTESSSPPRLDQGHGADEPSVSTGVAGDAPATPTGAQPPSSVSNATSRAPQGAALATPDKSTPRRSVRGRVLAEPGATGSPRGVRLPDEHPSVEMSWVDEQPDENNADGPRASEINRAAAMELVAHNAALREAEAEAHRKQLAAEFAAAEAERKKAEQEELAEIERIERIKRASNRLTSGMSCSGSSIE